MAMGFIAISPDALMRQHGQGRAALWLPCFNLVWTVWLFVTPLYEPRHFQGWLWPTLLSLALFLPLYALAYAGPRGRLLYCIGGMTALGFALLPFNPAAQCYIIYACAFFGFALKPRQAMTAIAGVLLLYALAWWLRGWSLLYMSSAVLVGSMVGLINIGVDIRARADAALRLSHDEVRRLAALAERERIGRDLHDLLGHTLSLVALKAELAGRLVEREPLGARREIDEVARVSREALAQVRRAVTGIRAAGLAAELASARLLLGGAGILLEPPCELPAMAPEQETVFALVLRESITNIHRHARASRVTVGLAPQRGRLLLTVADDGRGGDIVPGNGVSGMRERLQALGGELRIDARAGHGTVLSAALPLASAPEGGLGGGARVPG